MLVSNNMAKHIIVYVEMGSLMCAVERRDHPELAGRPFAISNTSLGEVFGVIVNRSNGEKIKMEKPIKRKTVIKRTLEKEQRYVVKLKVKMGKNLITADFSLNDRSKFDYQVLIGRNIINGRYLVDTSISNTLR